MSRSVPWRNKPTNLITQMIPVAKQLKLYLVHQIGPTSLILKDDNDNKFKVVIGNTVNCSCGVVKNDHCIHSLFVMLKKFKVNEDHPILWQASYIDSELDGLTLNKYQFVGNNGNSKKPSNVATFLKKKRLQKTQEEEFFPPLEEDQMCPICYQQMNGQCYSTCGVCSKSLHTNCFKVWTKHKEDSKTNVTCPMCRTIFSNPMNIIYRDLERWQLRFSTHKGTSCKGCGQKNIKGIIYKCLICPSADLCKMCYEGNQHIDHLLFVVKQLVTDKWKIAPLRAKKTRKQLFQPIQQIDLKQFPSIQSPQFILKLLPTFKVFNAYQNQNDLGIVGNQMLTKQICMKCETPGNQLMIRLSCGHGAHEECLISMFQNKEYFCEIDDLPICPGYLSALGVKILKPKKSKTDIKFIRNIDQTQKLMHKNAINPFSQHSNLPLKLKSTISSKQSQPRSRQNMSLGLNNSNNSNNINSSQNKNKEELTINRITGSSKLATKVALSKSKDNKNFRINKKSLVQRKHQIQSLSIGGFGMGSMGLIGSQESGTSSVLSNNNNYPISSHIIGNNNNHRPPLPRQNNANIRLGQNHNISGRQIQNFQRQARLQLQIQGLDMNNFSNPRQE